MQRLQLSLLALLLTSNVSVMAEAKQTVDGANQFFSQIIDDGHAKLLIVATKLPTQRTYTYSKRGWFAATVETQGTDQVFTSNLWEVKDASQLSKDSCSWSFTGNRTPYPVWQNDWLKSGSEYIYDHKYSGPETVTFNIDWGKVSISRAVRSWYKTETAGWGDDDYNKNRIPGTPKLISGIGTSITIYTNNSEYGEGLIFRGNDEMLDRIEYAAKFLQMSCDRTSPTGF